MIGKKVSTVSGDVRVAFDLIKACLFKILQKLKTVEGEWAAKDLKLQIVDLLSIMHEKYGQKIKELLAKIPVLQIIPL